MLHMFANVCTHLNVCVNDCTIIDFKSEVSYYTPQVEGTDFAYHYMFSGQYV